MHAAKGTPAVALVRYGGSGFGADDGDLVTVMINVLMAQVQTVRMQLPSGKMSSEASTHQLKTRNPQP